MSTRTTLGTGDDLVKVEDLKVHFTGRRGGAPVRAVDGVTLSIGHRETLGLVGESGCGKSTLGRAILRLLEPTSGSVILDGINLTDLDPEDLRRTRRRMQIIFQDPFGSLNPRMTIGQMLQESLLVHQIAKGEEAIRRVESVLQAVGLPTDAFTRYPHEFSGGQRQRAAIARALMPQPDLIIADEAVSALDVSIQAQILNLMADLQEEFGLTYLFIAHDLAVVRHVSDRIAVMYLGGIVELAPTDHLHRRPLHPYTASLLSAIPVPDPDLEMRRERIILKGDVPSPVDPPTGCRFHPRCWLWNELDRPAICVTTPPQLTPKENGEASAACHFSAEMVSRAAKVTIESAAVPPEKGKPNP